MTACSNKLCPFKRLCGHSMKFVNVIQLCSNIHVICVFGDRYIGNNAFSMHESQNEDFLNSLWSFEMGFNCAVTNIGNLVSSSGSNIASLLLDNQKIVSFGTILWSFRVLMSILEKVVKESLCCYGMFLLTL